MASTNSPSRSRALATDSHLPAYLPIPTYKSALDHVQSLPESASIALFFAAASSTLKVRSFTLRELEIALAYPELPTAVGTAVANGQPLPTPASLHAPEDGLFGNDLLNILLSKLLLDQAELRGKLGVDEGMGWAWVHRLLRETIRAWYRRRALLRTRLQATVQAAEKSPFLHPPRGRKLRGAKDEDEEDVDGPAGGAAAKASRASLGGTKGGAAGNKRKSKGGSKSKGKGAMEEEEDTEPEASPEAGIEEEVDAAGGAGGVGKGGEAEPKVKGFAGPSLAGYRPLTAGMKRKAEDCEESVDDGGEEGVPRLGEVRLGPTIAGGPTTGGTQQEVDTFVEAAVAPVAFTLTAAYHEAGYTDDEALLAGAHSRVSALLSLCAPTSSSTGSQQAQALEAMMGYGSMPASSPTAAGAAGAGTDGDAFSSPSAKKRRLGKELQELERIGSLQEMRIGGGGHGSARQTRGATTALPGEAGVGMMEEDGGEESGMPAGGADAAGVVAAGGAAAVRQGLGAGGKRGTGRPRGRPRKDASLLHAAQSAAYSSGPRLSSRMAAIASAPATTRAGAGAGGTPTVPTPTLATGAGAEEEENAGEDDPGLGEDGLPLIRKPSKFVPPVFDLTVEERDIIQALVPSMLASEAGEEEVSELLEWDAVLAPLDAIGAQLAAEEQQRGKEGTQAQLFTAEGREVLTLLSGVRVALSGGQDRNPLASRLWTQLPLQARLKVLQVLIDVRLNWLDDDCHTSVTAAHESAMRAAEAAAASAPDYASGLTAYHASMDHFPYRLRLLGKERGVSYYSFPTGMYKSEVRVYSEGEVRLRSGRLARTWAVVTKYTPGISVAEQQDALRAVLEKAEKCAGELLASSSKRSGGVAGGGGGEAALEELHSVEQLKESIQAMYEKLEVAAAKREREARYEAAIAGPRRTSSRLLPGAGGGGGTSSAHLSLLSGQGGGRLEGAEGEGGAGDAYSRDGDDAGSTGEAAYGAGMGGGEGGGGGDSTGLPLSSRSMGTLGSAGGMGGSSKGKGSILAALAAGAHGGPAGGTRRRGRGHGAVAASEGLQGGDGGLSVEAIHMHRDRIIPMLDGMAHGQRVQAIAELVDLEPEYLRYVGMPLQAAVLGNPGPEDLWSEEAVERVWDMKRAQIEEEVARLRRAHKEADRRAREKEQAAKVLEQVYEKEEQKYAEQEKLAAVRAARLARREMGMAATVDLSNMDLRPLGEEGRVRLKVWGSYGAAEPLDISQGTDVEAYIAGTAKYEAAVEDKMIAGLRDQHRKLQVAEQRGVVSGPTGSADGGATAVEPPAPHAAPSPSSEPILDVLCTGVSAARLWSSPVPPPFLLRAMEAAARREEERRHREEVKRREREEERRKKEEERRKEMAEAEAKARAAHPSSSFAPPMPMPPPHALAMHQAASQQAAGGGGFKLKLKVGGGIAAGRSGSGEDGAGQGAAMAGLPHPHAVSPPSSSSAPHAPSMMTHRATAAQPSTAAAAAAAPGRVGKEEGEVAHAEPAASYIHFRLHLKVAGLGPGLQEASRRGEEGGGVAQAQGQGEPEHQVPLTASISSQPLPPSYAYLFVPPGERASISRVILRPSRLGLHGPYAVPIDVSGAAVASVLTGGSGGDAGAAGHHSKGQSMRVHAAPAPHVVKAAPASYTHPHQAQVPPAGVPYPHPYPPPHQGQAGGMYAGYGAYGMYPPPAAGGMHMGGGDLQAYAYAQAQAHAHVQYVHHHHQQQQMAAAHAQHMYHQAMAQQQHQASSLTTLAGHSQAVPLPVPHNMPLHYGGQAGPVAGVDMGHMGYMGRGEGGAQAAWRPMTGLAGLTSPSGSQPAQPGAAPQ